MAACQFKLSFRADELQCSAGGYGQLLLLAQTVGATTKGATSHQSHLSHT